MREQERSSRKVRDVLVVSLALFIFLLLLAILGASLTPLIISLLNPPSQNSSPPPDSLVKLVSRASSLSTIVAYNSSNLLSKALLEKPSKEELSLLSKLLEESEKALKLAEQCVKQADMLPSETRDKLLEKLATYKKLAEIGRILDQLPLKMNKLASKLRDQLSRKKLDKNAMKQYSSEIREIKEKISAALEIASSLDEKNVISNDHKKALRAIQRNLSNALKSVEQLEKLINIINESGETLNDLKELRELLEQLINHLQSGDREQAKETINRLKDLIRKLLAKSEAVDYAYEQAKELDPPQLGTLADKAGEIKDTVVNSKDLRSLLDLLSKLEEMLNKGADTKQCLKVLGELKSTEGFKHEGEYAEKIAKAEGEGAGLKERPRD